ncbi:RHS repeat domain-containing protein [Pseudoflavitalea rhizosphaerae]|uniref:RHS repeat domain-containing protein n=1 Tax=Pseudoflavitalea rhizosphaerae TaxID=1884793 RepID=UPI000F8E87D2|nr:RHS repeat-associated core domain-containing protein [Pseudoflavitalea rhizosphaerae]
MYSRGKHKEGPGLKQFEYDYDLISGKVNLVKYQQNANDRFYYQYKYDAENRVTEAWSGTNWADGVLTNGKKDAHYRYYLHGPLARTALGENVQGLDYAYTLQGWLKGLNSQTLDNSTDPVVQNRDIGRDGAPGINASFNRDEVAFSLHYFGGDFKPLGGISSGAFEIGMSNDVVAGTGNALYNGNIARMTTAIRKFGNADFKGYSYRYDQLNRIKSLRVDNLSGISSPSTWNIGTDNAYGEDVTYDGNGNIKTYFRNGANLPGMSLQMDNLTYLYKPGTNQLLQVTDNVNKDNYTEALNQTEDLDGENNYEYDKIGNLIRDRKVINGVQESEIQVRWNVYGKIAGITKHDGVEISYQYDAAGNRVRKSVLKNGQTTDTWYAKDAQGNTIAVYSNKHNDQTGNYWLEQHLFGSSRIGVWNPAIDISNTTGTSVWNQVGKKSLEISNHLGNVLAVVSDKNIGTGVAEVLSASDYYPFGMLMPGRKFSSSSYRYRFNGKENDNEVKGGEGNQIDFGGRIHDPRIGRFLSVDPLASGYAGESNYSFAGNSPIALTDFNGYFKISPYFVKRYPTLARILQDYLPLLKDNPQIKKAWIQTTGYKDYAEGEKAFNQMVTYGEGPWITPTREQNEFNGMTGLSRFFEPTGTEAEFSPYDYVDNLSVSHSWLDKLETAFKTSNDLETGKQMFVVSLLIMHESAHWGTFKNGITEGDDAVYERGAMFEENAFGRRFTYRYPRIADKNLNAFDEKIVVDYYSKELGRYGSPSFGMSINNFDKNSFYWKNVGPILGGQKGDPTLKDNKDREPTVKPFVPSRTYDTGGNRRSNDTTY